MGRRWLTLLKEMEDKIADMSRNKRINVEHKSFLTQRLDQLRDECMEMEVSKALEDIKKEFKKDLMKDIRDELKTIAMDIQDVARSEEGKPKTSYADMVKDLQVESKKKKEVIVVAKEGAEVEDPRKIKEMLQETVNPGQEAMQIDHIRTAGKKRLIIQMRTSEDKAKLVSPSIKEKLDKKGLKVEDVKKKDPKIIVFSINRDIPEKDFMENAYHQNFKDADIPFSDFKDGFRYCFARGNRDSKVCHRVFQVTPAIREHIMAKEKIYAGWESYFVKDYTTVTRCYRCHGFGHTSQGCREKEDSCGHCAKKGHRFVDCPNKDRREVCVNCRRFGKDHDHSTFDVNCPAYRYALERDILRTGYSKN